MLGRPIAQAFLRLNKTSDHPPWPLVATSVFWNLLWPSSHPQTKVQRQLPLLCLLTRLRIGTPLAALGSEPGLSPARVGINGAEAVPGRMVHRLFDTMQKWKP